MDIVYYISHDFSSGRGSFSRSRPRGTQQEARVYTRLKFGPWPRSVARALGIQTRENWQATAESVSAEPQPA